MIRETKYLCEHGIFDAPCPQGCGYTCSMTSTSDDEGRDALINKLNVALLNARWLADGDNGSRAVVDVIDRFMGPVWVKEYEEWERKSIVVGG